MASNGELVLGIDAGLWGPFEDAVLGGSGRSKPGRPARAGRCAGCSTRWAARCPAADAAAAVAPGAEGLTVLDFWQGSRTPVKDPTARGAIWGLTTAHGPGHLLRAVYEGTAYGNRAILEMLRRLAVPTDRILACGGGTRSALWLRILADVAGIPLTLTDAPDAVALGSAMCAAVGAGACPDLRAAAAAMVREARTVEPDPSTRAVYDEGYARYWDTYAALAPLYRRAAR